MLCLEVLLCILSFSFISDSLRSLDDLHAELLTVSLPGLLNHCLDLRIVLLILLKAGDHVSLWRNRWSVDPSVASVHLVCIGSHYIFE